MAPEEALGEAPGAGLSGWQRFKLQVYLSAEQEERLRHLARRRGLGLSSLARSILLREIERAEQR